MRNNFMEEYEKVTSLIDVKDCFEVYFETTDEMDNVEALRYVCETLREESYNISFLINSASEEVRLDYIHVYTWSCVGNGDFHSHILSVEYITTIPESFM